ncbi:hypothetical protein CJD36_002450 [Flavipsychrobacter stenotrophus]|uniref:DUF7674 domain-containing protein n=1 Tax=Flavipsychrobacter stenotrophus TaxID=2077091 RepID=A0A2S7T0A7_9BACT|nr:hypothetical protein [Flavipsychrobacter stenotrophus]PQJ12622.1 hypothetical protein CJD36_002450 [Flavipsychrobacter stenotrophus]
MINQLEIPMFIEEALPEMPRELLTSKQNTAYDLLGSLTTFTCKNINDHNYRSVKRAFQIADKLYAKGNGVVKNAVENVFVYSFTRMFNTYPNEKKELLAILPITLYTIYMAQVCHKGC